MGVFGAVFGRRGVAGFSRPVLGASRGVIGIKVAMFLRPVREVFLARRCAGLGCSTAREAGCGGGFALHEAFQGCVAGVSEPHVVQFPPLGGGEAATHSGVVPKVQTTSAKNGENGVLWARWTTFWAHRCLARCTCSRVSPLFRVSTRYVTRQPAIWSEGGGCPRSHERADVRMKGPRPPPIGLTCV